MKYSVAINDNESITGPREVVQGVIAGAMLTAGFDGSTGDITAMEKARFVLDLADGLGPDDTQGLDLGDSGELLTWRERGREAPGRAYLVKVGDIAPAFRATSQGLLVAYIMALMVADGVHIDKAGALGEMVANTLSEGGKYPDGGEVAELKDGRRVTAWWEDEA